LLSTEEVPVSESERPPESRSVEAAALQRGEQHPEQDVEHPTPDQPQDQRVAPNRHSASAEAAALRWQEQHDDEDVEHPVPAAVPEDEHVVPNRHSASAEAAALRWHEQHDEEDS
jgi:hypothetical protein